MLKEIIDQFYLEQQKDKEQFHFYITDAGKCSRAIFFKFKNAPKAKMDARLLRIFEHGEYLHRNIFNILYRLKMGVTTEVNIPSQALVSGRADAIICVNGENYVLDIKSINSFIFKSLAAPKEENLFQLQLYMHYFGISKGILLYIDKDQQELKEFFVSYDKEMCEALIKNFEILQTKIEQNQVPSVLPDYPRNWQCNYCQFRQVCDLCGRDEIGWEACKDKVKTEEPEN